MITSSTTRPDKPKTKARILELLPTGSIRNPSIVSAGRTVGIFGDTAVVHGSEDDAVVFGGKRSKVRYLYLVVLEKRNEEWKIAASQLAKLSA